MGRCIGSFVVLALLGLVACGGAQQRAAEPSEEGSQVCVVRHAEAYKNLEPRPADVSEDQLDSLTPKGEEQARELGPTLPEPVGLLWSSPTNRTRRTAELLGLDERVQIVDELGELEGDPGALLERVRAELGAGEHAVLVTHRGIAALLVGELKDTPLAERKSTHVLETGEAVCLPLR